MRRSRSAASVGGTGRRRTGVALAAGVVLAAGLAGCGLTGSGGHAGQAGAVGGSSGASSGVTSGGGSRAGSAGGGVTTSPSGASSSPAATDVAGLQQAVGQAGTLADQVDQDLAGDAGS